MAMPRIGLPAVVAIAAAAVAIVAALIMLGSPARAREHRLDELRVQDLASIANALDSYWTKHAAMPDTVDSLVSARLLDRIPADPSSGVRYPIYLTGARSYRLCATFSQPLDTTDRSQYNYYGGLYRGPRSWRHGAGESCFDFSAERTDVVRPNPRDVQFEMRSQP